MGFCLACGADAEGVEPNARGYECEECGARKVYGAEECLIMCTRLYWSPARSAAGLYDSCPTRVS